MNATESELIAAIRENPDDDDLRRVLADFWIQNGDPRGELISLQLDPRPEVQGRAQAIIDKNRDRWGLSDVGRPIFERGLLAEVSVPVEALAAEGDRLFANHPALLRITLEGGITVTDVMVESQKVAESSWLSQLRSFVYKGGPLEDPGLTALLTSPHWIGLRRIVLDITTLHTEAATAMAHNPALQNLRSLKLIHGVDTRLLRILLDRPGGWASLAALEIRKASHVRDPAFLDVLAGASSLPSLWRLGLWGGYPADDLVRFLRSPLAARLREFAIDSQIGPQVVPSLLALSLDRLTVKGADEATQARLRSRYGRDFSTDEDPWRWRPSG